VGGILSLIMIVLGAIYFFAMRLSKNKRAIEQDDFAGGAAWFVIFVIGIFTSLFILSYIRSYLDTLDQPIRIIAQIVIGLIFLYIPYKVACLVAPAEDQDKENDENLK
jgi:sulfite exporter TauE/SafE